ncbi:hypothetical protein JCM16418A_43740 [Paenibacillus pini]
MVRLIKFTKTWEKTSEMRLNFYRAGKREIQDTISNIYEVECESSCILSKKLSALGGDPGCPIWLKIYLGYPVSVLAH